MDIGVSSNFERFLFHMLGDDSKAMAELMTRFEAEGDLKPSAALVAAARAQMDSAAVQDDEVLATIADVHAKSAAGGAEAYTLDPHSAIGVAAARKVRTAGTDSPMICLACAHWAKFPDANRMALGETEASKLVVPEPLASLHTLPTRVQPLPYDVSTVQSFIKQTISKK
jgi:threonine synthase